MSHVSLATLPDPNGPLAERRAAYAQLQATSAIIREGRQNGALVYAYTQTVALGDGTQVHYTSDMLAVVGPSTLSGRLFSEEQQLRVTLDRYLGIHAAIASTALIGSLVAVFTTGIGRGYSEVPFWLAVGTFSVSIFSGSIGAGFLHSHANGLRELGLRSYNYSLRDELNLCGDPPDFEDCRRRGPHRSTQRVRDTDPDANSPAVPPSNPSPSTYPNTHTHTYTDPTTSTELPAESQSNVPAPSNDSVDAIPNQ